jgi:ABC-2 type transport system permease protein
MRSRFPLLAFTHALFATNLRSASFGLVMSVAGGVRHLGRFIDEGELDPLIAQPKPTLLYAVGSRSQAHAFGDFLSGIALVFVSGRATWSNAPRVLFALLASAAIFLGCGIAFHSLAFWLRKTETLARQLWELLIKFSVYPEPLFGGVLRLVLFSLLPAGFVGHLPVRVIREGTLADAALLFAGACGYLALSILVFSRGLRRYSSGSRFGVFG